MWNWPAEASLAIATVIHLDGGVAQHGPLAPDLHYGHHAGFARLSELLQRAEHPVSWVLRDGRLQQLPQIAQFVSQRGDDLIACVDPLSAEEAEASVLARAASLLPAAATRGWLGHPMRSAQTAELLLAAGFDHALAPSPLDLPFVLEVPATAGLVVLPLLAEIDDLQLLDAGHAPELWLQAVIDSVDTLLEEAQSSGQPRQLTLQLHLPVIARPARIRALQQLLNYFDQLDGLWRTTAGAIAAHVRAAALS